MIMVQHVNKTEQQAIANRHVLIVLNPVAGRQQMTEEVTAALRRHFPPELCTYNIYETTGEENLTEVVHNALQNGVDVVVAAGGDGTVSKVADGLVGSEIPLGIIPLGTANALAQELAIPLDLEQACHLISTIPATTWLDAMHVQGQRFFLRVGIGLDAEMIQGTESRNKRRFGRLAYIGAFLKRFFGYQPRRFTMVIDGNRHRLRASQVLVANGGALGSSRFQWGPDIRPDDGHVDVCIVYARTIADYLPILWHIVLRRQRRSRNLRYIPARQRVTVHTDDPQPVQADGDTLEPTPVQIDVISRAVQVVVPASS